MTIYICYGCPKSGSTLAFELTCELLRRTGHPQDRLPAAILDQSHSVNFVGSEDGLTMDLLRGIEKVIPKDRIIALKTHVPPPAEVLERVQKGSVFAQAIFRDPRDNALSLRDAGRKARANGELTFSYIQGTLDAITVCKQGLANFEQWARIPQTLTAEYEEVAFGSQDFLNRIIRQLGLPSCSQEMLIEIEQETKERRFTQMNKAVSVRHVEELTVKQNAALTRHFRDFLVNWMPDNLDAYDRIALADAGTPPHSGVSDRQLEALFPPAESDIVIGKTRTRKTFVVLSVPLDGSSLFAGALYHCGVSMGNFRTTRYEDPDFRIDPKKTRRAKRLLRPGIRARNHMHEYWGCNLPEAASYIADIEDELINPEYFFIYRDPEAFARTSARRDNVDWTPNRDRLIAEANRHIAKLEALQTKVRGKVHVFRHEEILANPDGFVDRLLEIVAPLAPAREDILRFVTSEDGDKLPETRTFADYSVTVTPNVLKRATSRSRRFGKSLRNFRHRVLAATLVRRNAGTGSA